PSSTTPSSTTVPAGAGTGPGSCVQTTHVRPTGRARWRSASRGAAANHAASSAAVATSRGVPTTSGTGSRTGGWAASGASSAPAQPASAAAVNPAAASRTARPAGAEPERDTVELLNGVRPPRRAGELPRRAVVLGASGARSCPRPRYARPRRPRDVGWQPLSVGRTMTVDAAPRVALLGVHGFGRVHLDGLLRLAGTGAVRVAGLADPRPPDPDALERVRALPGGADVPVLADAAELLDRVRPDVTIVSTPI